jgi:hypothetical protein
MIQTILALETALCCVQVPCLDGLPICGAVGDQHAALLGHACLDVGSSKNTYGSGPTDPRPGTVQVQSGYMFLVFLSISLSFESRRVQRESQDAIGRNAFLELQYTIFFFKDIIFISSFCHLK